MPNSIKKLEEAFKEGKYDQLLKDIYVDESVLAYQQERYIKALESFFCFGWVKRTKTNYDSFISL